MRTQFLMTLAAVLAVSVSAQVPVIGCEAKTLRTLAGKDTLVTVVLEGSGARDRNLKVLDVFDTYFSVRSLDGKRHVYLFDMVKSVEVQGGKIAERQVSSRPDRVLRKDEQQVVDRAWVRAKDLFGKTNDNQALKMKAATISAANNDGETLTYLEKLANGNDLTIALEAATELWLVGNTEHAAAVVKAGLASPTHSIKALAARLAGLIGYDQDILVLESMARDRAEIQAAPAIRALARLGRREAMPIMMDALLGQNEVKGEAAVFALSTLGGDDVVKRVKAQLEETKGHVWYRLVRVLYKLNDELGKKLLREESMEVVTLAADAALILAKEGDWEAMQYLRNELKARKDLTLANFTYKAFGAAALIQGGDLNYKRVLQDLLRLEPPDVFPTDPTRKEQSRKDVVRTIKMTVCELTVDIGNPSMLTLIHPAVESADPYVALAACESAAALASPEFREGLLELRQ